ncbi:MAG: competence/damage-inducible protein A [Nitrospirae bacterium]|nr:competence/damage-inducible protein A [Nitrospirota bacterium]
MQDYNAFFMAKELWAHGVQLCRISIIPDIIDEIADEVKKYSDRFDYVFTSGGIGPTHDDVTIEGISKAFNVKIVTDPTLYEILLSKLGNLSQEQLKMAEIPEGAELITEDNLSFPLIKFKNIFILPGIPELLRKKFFALEKIFNEPQIFLKKIYIQESESAIAPLLKDVLKKIENIKIGSYPIMNIRDYNVIVTIESSDETFLKRAVDNLIENLPKEKIFKVE